MNRRGNRVTFWRNMFCLGLGASKAIHEKLWDLKNPHGVTLKIVGLCEFSMGRSFRLAALRSNVLCLPESLSTSCLLTAVYASRWWTTLTVGWAHWRKTARSQAMSSFVVYSSVKSYSLINSLQIPTDQGHAHSEDGSIRPLVPMPGSTHLMGCLLEQSRAGVLHLYGWARSVHPGGVCAWGRVQKCEKRNAGKVQNHFGSYVNHPWLLQRETLLSPSAFSDCSEWLPEIRVQLIISSFFSKLF